MELPPPAKNEVPDYFLGRLIFEMNDGNACKWVVYNGNDMLRFPSRSAAEKWCIKHTYQVDKEDVGKILQCIARLNSCYQLIDDLSPRITEDTIRLQGIAFSIRRNSDDLDILVSKYLT